MSLKIEKLEQKIAALRRAARAEKRAQRAADDRELLLLIRRAGLGDQVRWMCIRRIEEREDATDGREIP
ncbi:MAG: hypothetical protein EPN36_12130 [Rhodanobacteraceae bacterium]|nr:MAG: hypothetical protein EPN36_12130 [Rhodanobacteraceae bacterium]